ncbi:ParA family protein [uncultured Ruegeria sp.]|uniref:ParA family protein n=1 Tax=uncultured Ruegeria sp. TaxID=259304 RepID=UPI0026193B56|nr:ParA family protein [uncultured Ruegeria sp.]
MIISCISQKGGVGKSTLARLMAVEMARAGWSTLIADLDAAQGTSTTWHHKRQQAEASPEVDVMRYRSVEKAVKDSDRYDLTILDGPAHAEKGGITMARHSNLILIPSGYSTDDLEPQVKVAYELEEAGVDPDKIRIALCRLKGSKKEGEGVRNYLRRARVNALDSELRELQVIRQAHMAGLAASETTHKGINQEAHQLAVEISQLLTAGD